MKSKQDLTVGNINKKLWAFAIPLMLGNVMQQFYNLVDTWVVGKYIGDNALAAVGSSYSLMTFLTSVILGLCLGSSAFFSITFGEKNIKRLKNGMFISFVMIGIFSLILTFASFYLCGRIMKILQVPYDIQGIMSEYLKWIFVGIFATFLYNYFSNLLRGIGNSVIPLVFLCVSVILNIGLDLYFVLVLKQGIRGAAIATVTAQALSVVFAIVILIKKELPFKITRKDFGLNSQCKKFLKIGLPLALQEFLTQMSFLALCAFVNRLGLEASSGYGVACKIVNFAMLVPSALMQSMASFVSQNIGAGKAKRAKKSMFTGIGVGLVVGCIVFLLVMFGGDILAGFFTTDVAVIQKGYAYLKGFALETIVTAILFSMVGYFNGNNKTVWVMTQGLIQTLLVRLPFAYVMSIQPNASLTKIGLAAPVSTMVGIVLNVGFYIYLDRAEKKSNAL